MKYKIIVAHPGKQHSYKLASALKKCDQLLYYVTTVYYKNNSILIRILTKFLSEDNVKRIINRHNNDIDDSDVIQYCQLSGFWETFLARYDKNHAIYRYFQRRDSTRFGKKVAKLAISSGADAVITYDSNAIECFSYLENQAPWIKRILDVSIVPRPYMKYIYEKEIAASGNNDLKEENRYLWNNNIIEELTCEINASQFFLAPSEFVRQGLMKCGVKENQIAIVPYGANVVSNYTRTRIFNRQKVEFLFVGQVNYRKGVSYLIEAMKHIGDKAHLTITGAYNNSEWFVKDALDQNNITLTGLVTPDKMKDIYNHADVFVIPSFAEGMAQVGIEAMACGLPIICTFNSGDSDMVEDGINGFIIKCGNLNELIDKMNWFINNKDQIAIMGNRAKATASKYSWSSYEKNVVSAIDYFIEDKHL